MEKESAKYLTLAQIEREFGIDAKTLYRQINSGTIPAYKPFGKIMVKRRDIEAVFQRGRVHSA
jgi:predicted DNA-binding transcriptional regulator AlpA